MLTRAQQKAVKHIIKRVVGAITGDIYTSDKQYPIFPCDVSLRTLRALDDKGLITIQNEHEIAGSKYRAITIEPKFWQDEYTKQYVQTSIDYAETQFNWLTKHFNADLRTAFAKEREAYLFVKYEISK